MNAADLDISKMFRNQVGSYEYHNFTLQNNIISRMTNKF